MAMFDNLVKQALGAQPARGIGPQIVPASPSLPDPRLSLSQLGIADAFTVAPDNSIVYKATGQVVPFDYFLSGQYQNDMTTYGNMRSIGGGNPFAPAAPAQALAPAPAGPVSPSFDIYARDLGNGTPGSASANDSLDTILVDAGLIPGGSDGPGGWSFTGPDNGNPLVYTPKWVHDMGLQANNQSHLQGYTNTYGGPDGYVYAAQAAQKMNDATGQMDFNYADPNSWIRFKADDPRAILANTGKQSALNGVTYERLDANGNVIGTGTFSGLKDVNNLPDYVVTAIAAGLMGGGAAGLFGGEAAGAGLGLGDAAVGSGAITGADMAAGAGIGAGVPGAAFGGIGTGAAGAGFGIGTLPELGIGGASTFGTAGITGGLLGGNALLDAAATAPSLLPEGVPPPVNPEALPPGVPPPANPFADPSSLAPGLGSKLLDGLGSGLLNAGISAGLGALIGGGSKTPAVPDLTSDEAARQKKLQDAIDAINTQFGYGDSDAAKANKAARASMYGDISGAVHDTAMRDLDKQFTTASNRNTFGLARSGLLGGSVDAESGGDLQTRYGEGQLKATQQGQQSASDLRSQDEKSRQNLISLAQSGLDVGTANSLAGGQLASSADAAKSNATGATVGRLFDDMSQSYVANQTLKARYPTGLPTAAGYSSNLFTGKKYAGNVQG